MPDIQVFAMLVAVAPTAEDQMLAASGAHTKTTWKGTDPDD